MKFWRKEIRMDKFCTSIRKRNYVYYYFYLKIYKLKYLLCLKKKLFV